LKRVASFSEARLTRPAIFINVFEPNTSPIIRPPGLEYRRGWFARRHQSSNKHYCRCDPPLRKKQPHLLNSCRKFVRKNLVGRSNLENAKCDEHRRHLDGNRHLCRDCVRHEEKLCFANARAAINFSCATVSRSTPTRA
jgi:hypothetical protein